ncbi:hypothetical protein GLYMA_12G181950v4 [Glycine max]|nr:hypothetical protein GLYMA_12G181950v4 [Glycine max]KAH1143797.1 hypothetical protein GYH30_034149 [Glycine max]
MHVCHAIFRSNCISTFLLRILLEWLSDLYHLCMNLEVEA